MNNYTFNVLWTECVEKAGTDVLKVFSERVKEKYHWRCDFSTEKKNEVLARYKENNKEFRSKYFYGKDDPDKLIDVHKIASCFSKSVIDASMMSFDVPRSPEDKRMMPWFIKVSNYALAFHVSVNIMSFFMQADYERVSYSTGNYDYLKRFQSLKKIHFPTTTEGHDTYTIGRIKAISMRDIMDEEFDMLAYADMLFWIEFYNRQLVENQVNLKPKKMRIE